MTHLEQAQGLGVHTLNKNNDQHALSNYLAKLHEKTLPTAVGLFGGTRGTAACAPRVNRPLHPNNTTYYLMRLHILQQLTLQDSPYFMMTALVQPFVDKSSCCQHILTAFRHLQLKRTL